MFYVRLTISRPKRLPCTFTSILRENVLLSHRMQGPIRKLQQQSLPPDSTIDTFWINRGVLTVGLIKHLLGLDQWLLGCMRLSIFIKARVTSKGDRVSRYCELREGGGTRDSCVNAFQKPVQDETLWRFMASVNHLANVLKPEQVGVAVWKRTRHIAAPKVHCDYKFEWIQTGLNINHQIKLIMLLMKALWKIAIKHNKPQ